MSPPELVVFPDVELAGCAWLRGRLSALASTVPVLAGVYVGISLPHPRPDKAVILRRDGGPRLDGPLEAARMSINVYAPTDRVATDLARYVRAILTGWKSDPIARVRDLSAPSSVADASRMARRFFTQEWVVRGVGMSS
ncbi:MAG: hypothetical protein ACRC0L_01335 [Angustibacter sp.]